MACQFDRPCVRNTDCHLGQMHSANWSHAQVHEANKCARGAEHVKRKVADATQNDMRIHGRPKQTKTSWCVPH